MNILLRVGFISVTLMHYSIIFCMIDSIRYGKAIKMVQAQDLSAAQSTLEDLLVDNYNRPDLQYDLGVVSYSLKNFDKAKACFAQVVENSVAPLLLKEQALFNLGNVAVAQNQLEEAIEWYNRVLEQNPDNAHAQHNVEKVKEMLHKKNEQEKEKKGDNEQKKDNKSNSNENKKKNKSDTPASSSHDNESGKGDNSEDSNGSADAEKNSSKVDNTKKNEPEEEKKGKNEQKKDNQPTSNENKKNGRSDTPDSSSHDHEKDKGDNSEGSSGSAEPKVDAPNKDDKDPSGEASNSNDAGGNSQKQKEKATSNENNRNKEESRTAKEEYKKEGSNKSSPEQQSASNQSSKNESSIDKRDKSTVKPTIQDAQQLAEKNSNGAPLPAGHTSELEKHSSSNQDAEDGWIEKLMQMQENADGKANRNLIRQAIKGKGVNNDQKCW